MGMALPTLSFAKYLSWESQQADRHEFYRGVTFAMGGGTRAHNRVIVNLTRRIDAHLEGTECEVFSENMKLELDDQGCFYPDVMVACGKRFKDGQLSVTDPLLIIEVLSLSTKGYDRRDKFVLYRQLSSLREYALIDPVTRIVEVFGLVAGGGWLLKDQTNEGALTLGSIAAQFPFDWVFRGLESEAS